MNLGAFKMLVMVCSLRATFQAPHCCGQAQMQLGLKQVSGVLCSWSRVRTVL